MSKKCSKCGAILEDNSAFCTECGAQTEKTDSNEVNFQSNNKLNTRKCPNCGAALQDDDIFCTECGTKIQDKANTSDKINHSETNNNLIRCPNCGAALQSNAVFCTACGTKIQVGPANNNAGQANNMNNFTYTNNTPPKKSNLKKGISIIGTAIVVILFILSRAGVFNDSDTHTNSGSSITVKAEDMANDYIRDQSSAESTYKDKKVKITGQVINKAQFLNNQDYGVTIFFKESGGKTYSIIVAIDNKNVDDVNKLHEGDFVSAEGTCLGIVKQKDPTDITIQIMGDKINK
ncbi:zinc-ribbon domain-containing protein [Pectinatus cerevisiiphilus]|uniref:Zinc ribbon protein n=1 Tax=Pectinatus cerevisiiphilus TaxID=86956 RepID=A0A4V2USH3_9FIRM|nr:zinc-ribbon domain-containing protein [Pectinatus cerevisiiphilus]TCS81412.1 zinc ribbon protein [Pectinatus cerevisiiphilus]